MNDSPGTTRSTDINVSQALRVFRERKWVIICVAVLALAVSLALSVRKTPEYRATAEVVMQTNSLDKVLFGDQVFEIIDEQRALMTAAGLVKLDQVAERVKSNLGTSRSTRSLQNMVSVTASATADIISISAQSTSASEAANVANSFARQFVLFRQATDRATLQNARAEVQAQFDAMTPQEQASAGGLTLSQKIEELAVLESMQTGGFGMARVATPPSSAFSPRTRRNAAIALVLGLVGGLMVAILLHFVDRRMKDEETFEREFGVPIIASVPLVGRRASSKHKKRSRALVGFSDPGSPVIEAYRTLRSNLKFFEVNRRIKTILVTSALPREGKTITAINLALTLAMSGHRVIILEGDLRRPMIRNICSCAVCWASATC